ncbi:Tubby-like, C-terminal [Sesbania bispinosa]|nr:Tubby-like, C-terminal [Sesbania bispinosa]
MSGLLAIIEENLMVQYRICMDQPLVIQNSCWASLPPELLYDVIRRLEESENTWPARKHVVACAAVCQSWRNMCKEIVKNPEFSGKLTFPVSLKQHWLIALRLKINVDQVRFTYGLCSSALLVENGKFLLSAKRTRRTTYTEYVISMDADNISRSSNTYIGKLRSNFLGTKFIIYDTQPPYSSAHICPPGTGKTSRRFYSKKAQGRCTALWHSIPASALDAGGTVPGQPELLPRSLEDSFRSISFSKSLDHSIEFSSARFSEIGGSCNEDEDGKMRPLGSEKQAAKLIAATQPAAGAPTPSQPAPPEHDKIILQFGQSWERYVHDGLSVSLICIPSFCNMLEQL